MGNPHRIMLQAGGDVADHYIRADVASHERNADIAAAVKFERERIAALLSKMADAAAACWTCGYSVPASDLSRFVDEELGAP